MQTQDIVLQDQFLTLIREINAKNIKNNHFLKNNNTKRINIHSKYKQKNNNRQNKTKRYDRYVNML